MEKPCINKVILILILSLSSPSFLACLVFVSLFLCFHAFLFFFFFPPHLHFPASLLSSPILFPSSLLPYFPQHPCLVFAFPSPHVPTSPLPASLLSRIPASQFPLSPASLLICFFFFQCFPNLFQALSVWKESGRATSEVWFPLVADPARHPLAFSGDHPY